MQWTPRQREQIILAYAHDGVAFCPDDLEPLVIDHAPRPEINRRGVKLRCPICGRASNQPTVPLGVAAAS